jgi:hypothetical protein
MFGFIFRLLTLPLPAVLLLFASLRYGEEAQIGYLVGVAIQGLLLVVAFIYYRTPLVPFNPTAFACYSIGWLWYKFMVRAPVSGREDIYALLMEAVLVVVPVIVATASWLVHSGVIMFRAAQKVSKAILEKKDWPSNLLDCRELPVVHKFRESLEFDPSPALALLSDLRPEVRMAALSALKFRASWRKGQVDVVLNHLQVEQVPEVRTAAVLAVANINDRRVTEVIASSLHDPDQRVRLAAADALFWDPHRKWAWMRNGVRSALSEQKLQDTGPLLREGQLLPKEAVDDITAWAAERGSISVRAAQTLAVHYSRMLQDRPPETQPVLKSIVENPQAPPLLRIHLAHLLCKQRQIEPAVLEKLLDAANPATLRLLAAEMLLMVGPNNRALGILREIARLPNRDLALDTARIVQQCLNVDLGLTPGQPLPMANTPKAAEVSRRLMMWASRADSHDDALGSR